MQRLSSPAAERNKGPISDVLNEVLPASGLVLEIASGSGQHVAHFAKRFPHLIFQPSDPSAEARASITAWLQSENLPNIMPPLAIDCTAPTWPEVDAAAVVCINMVHISPWEATVGLLRWCGQHLPAGGPLILYGPYWIPGRDPEPSNLDFDQSLRARNPQWGIRRLEDVKAEAAQHHLCFDHMVAMPANNIIAVFRAD